MGAIQKHCRIGPVGAAGDVNRSGLERTRIAPLRRLEFKPDPPFGNAFAAAAEMSYRYQLMRLRVEQKRKRFSSVPAFTVIVEHPFFHRKRENFRIGLENRLAVLQSDKTPFRIVRSGIIERNSSECYILTVYQSKTETAAVENEFRSLRLENRVADIGNRQKNFARHRIAVIGHVPVLFLRRAKMVISRSEHYPAAAVCAHLVNRRHHRRSHIVRPLREYRQRKRRKKNIEQFHNHLMNLSTAIQ